MEPTGPWQVGMPVCSWHSEWQETQLPFSSASLGSLQTGTGQVKQVCLTCRKSSGTVKFRGHGSAYPYSTLQSCTQWPLRLKWRQDTHMSGPGPQQPMSVHSRSQVCCCCSVSATQSAFLIAWRTTISPTKTHSPQIWTGLLLRMVAVWSADLKRRVHWKGCV